MACRYVYINAHILLGMAYLGGDGVDRDIDQAIYHFKRSSDLDDSTAQYCLGLIYSGSYESCEDRKDFALAVRYFRQAASNGTRAAYLRLGIILLYGRGVERDLKEAFALFRSAADSGLRIGKCLLGLCYQRGEGVEKNLNEPMRLFREAEKNQNE